MTTPRPPSVVTNISGDPIPPAISSDARLFMVGSGTAAAPRPQPYSRDLESIEAHLPQGSLMRNAVDAIFRKAEPEIAIATLDPVIAGHSTVNSGLDLVRFLERRPTHIYAPGLTSNGTTVGTLANNINDAATTITLTVAHDGISDGEILQVENELMEVDGDAAQGTDITVIRGAEGTAAAAHLAGRTVVDLRNPVVTHLEELCEELECVAISEAPNVDVQHAIAWADAGNVRQNVMGIYNYADGMPPGADWLGTTMRVHSEFGHQRGIEHARVTGVTSLARELSHSPRASVTTDVSRLVGAYMSTLVRRNGLVEIVGHTFKGVSDARRLYSNALVVHRVQRLAEIAAEDYIGQVSSDQNMRDLAFHVEQGIRSLVNSREIRFVTVVPHPTLDTPVARANGIANLFARIGLYFPITHVVIDLTLPIHSTDGG